MSEEEIIAEAKRVNPSLWSGIWWDLWGTPHYDTLDGSDTKNVRIVARPYAIEDARKRLEKRS